MWPHCASLNAAVSPAGPPPMMPTFLPVGAATLIGCSLPSLRTWSAAKYLSCAMEIGCSTRLRRHAFSHGCGHTRPMAAGSGNVSFTVATASAKRPSAISFTYFWQSVWAGQLSLQGPWQSPSWSPIRSSSASLRVASAFSLFVWTTMPGATFAEQARSIFGQFSTSTTHTPHAP